MKLRNISEGKVIGVGEVNILPGEEKEIPKAYETSPILEVYKKAGVAEIIGAPVIVEKTEEELAAEKAEAERQAAESAEALRLARLEAIKGKDPEIVAKIANELGIDPASCKDQADVLKKVTAALKKK